MRRGPRYTYRLRHSIVALYCCLLIPAHIAASIYWMYVYVQANSPWITNLPLQWLLCRLVFAGFWITFMITSMTCPAVFSEGRACIRCSPILLVAVLELGVSMVDPKHCHEAVYAAIFNSLMFLHHSYTSWWKAYTRRPVTPPPTTKLQIQGELVPSEPQPTMSISVAAQEESYIYPSIPSCQ